MSEGAEVAVAAPRRPSSRELEVWRAFLRAHAALSRRLEADLIAEHAMPLATYDVLVQLVEAPERRLRMTELADKVLLSRSGLTRLVDRLEREGVVRREPCDTDARGTYAVLSEQGYLALREASPTHLRGVAEYALDLLSPQELDGLAGALGRLLGESVPAPRSLTAED